MKKYKQSLRSTLARISCLWSVLLWSGFYSGGVPSLAGEFESLFDGKTLAGWTGDEGFWSVQNGHITGESTAENPCRKNTFLVWTGEDVEDFEFVCQARFVGNNSGVQYRSILADAATFSVKGYQADLHPRHEYFGMMYCEAPGRGIVAQRFQQVEVGPDSKIKVLSEFGDKQQKWDGAEWNELRIVAVGDRMIHQINGVTTVDVTDYHPAARRSGILALQLHGGAPMKVEYRDIQLRRLEGTEAQERIQAVAPGASASGPDLIPFAVDLGSQWVLEGKKPRWIWVNGKSGKKPVFFRHHFDVQGSLRSAPVYFIGDNEARVWINGKLLEECRDWNVPADLKDSKSFLKPGKNQIAVQALNHGGPAAFVFKMQLHYEDGRSEQVVSDTNWKGSLVSEDGWDSETFDDRHWPQGLQQFGLLGVGPWGTPGLSESSSEAPQVLEGFRVEPLFHFPIKTYGSTVSLTTDDWGRLLACAQYGEGLHRITLYDDQKALHIEKMPVGLSGAQGLVWHQQSLYFQSGGGFYRVYDADGDDRLEAFEEIPVGRSRSEHGNHAVVVAEDGRHLYVVAGNHTPVPPASSTIAPRIQSWKEDFLLTREWDANGHARGLYAPGGWISRFDPELKTHQIFSIGYRNQYDVALNRYGDLFTYDADMEWDMGLPWYRPTRINFVVSGSDYGWRSGTAKWPQYFEDSLPAVLNVGPGSPTGIVSGKGAKFPAKYQDALFALDWSFGTIHAVYPEHQGAGYRATSEVFCYGTPLPLTDAVIGKDGALYFITGGRRASSTLYRIRYVGNESTDPLSDHPEVPELHQLRRSLEQYHGVVDEDALEAAWPHLSSPDRWLRHAARVAVESQPLSAWASRVFTEPDPQSRITAAVALARKGETPQQARLLESLLELKADALTPEQQLGLLRAYALSFIRLGNPGPSLRDRVITELDPLLPGSHDEVNTELVRLLVYLKAPSVIGKTLDLINKRGTPSPPEWNQDLIQRNKQYGGPIERMLANYPPVQEINYAFMLRNLKDGWTVEQRKRYFDFINSIGGFRGGNSYAKFLRNMRDQVLANMDNAEREALGEVTGENFNPVPDFPIHPPKGPGQNWTVESASRHVDRRQLKEANLESGRNLYHAVACAVCHRFDGLGGDVGPDLSMVRTKFDARYLLESIIEPSKAISDQYSSKIVTLKGGEVLSGIVVQREEDIDVYPMVHSSEELKPRRIAQDQIEQIEDSATSQMPPMLLNSLNGTEVRDLIAYLLSAGVPDQKK